MGLSKQSKDVCHKSDSNALPSFPLRKRGIKGDFDTSWNSSLLDPNDIGDRAVRVFTRVEGFWLYKGYNLVCNSKKNLIELKE
jgi:hypothetical protein